MNREHIGIKIYFYFGILLFIIGIFGSILLIFADEMGVGSPGFGPERLSGISLSVLYVFIGLTLAYRIKLPLLNRVLAMLCIFGIFYICLQGDPSKSYQTATFLTIKGSLGDIFLNILAFFPLGYLLMGSFNYSNNGGSINFVRRAIIYGGIGCSISLIIEISQYFIPGRSSSLIDIVANTIGTLIGATINIILQKISSCVEEAGRC